MTKGTGFGKAAAASSKAFAAEKSPATLAWRAAARNTCRLFRRSFTDAYSVTRGSPVMQTGQASWWKSKPRPTRKTYGARDAFVYGRVGLATLGVLAAYMKKMTSAAGTEHKATMCSTAAACAAKVWMSKHRYPSTYRAKRF